MRRRRDADNCAADDPDNDDIDDIDDSGHYDHDDNHNGVVDDDGGASDGCRPRWGVEPGVG